MNALQIVLVALVTFIFAIDQFSLTEVLYRPMVACPILGLILGDLQTGLVIGGTYELMMVGNMPIGGAQPPNAVLGAVVAMIFAVTANMDIDAALGAAMIFATMGQYVVTIVFTINSGFNKMCDDAAAAANTGKITTALNLAMALLGGLFAVIAVVACVAGAAAEPALTALSENASWVMGGLSAAGGMMRFVGFAVLLKIMMGNDMWGYLLGGFSLSLVFGCSGVASATLLLMAFVGFMFAFNDFLTNKKIAENAGMGGMTDGI